MTNELLYPGRELQAMACALNYHKWILEYFRPYLGKHVVEVGAGLGSFSELIIEHPIESLSQVEPSSSMSSALNRYANQTRNSRKVTTYNSTFRQIANKLKTTHSPDSIVYVNVLEHIEDDEAELKTVYDTLDEGGKLMIFVPALPWLYARFDEQVGHLRRYTKTELEKKCQLAGFRVLKSTYFDVVGILPWLVKYKFLRSVTMYPRTIKLYDRYVVPSARRLESAIKPPFGKNLIMVVERP